MSKGFTLQNIWESKIPVENGSTFKFKSTVWRSTRIEGLSGEVIRKNAFLLTNYNTLL